MATLAKDSDNDIDTSESPMFSKHVLPYIQPLLGVHKIGRNNIELRDAMSSNLDPQEEVDRFKIVIHYNDIKLYWEVLFNTHCTELPPDFIFRDNKFEPSLDSIPSLLNWETENEMALVDVIKELLNLYKEHQMSLLPATSRLRFEYDSLLENSSRKAEDVDVLVYTSSHSPHSKKVSVTVQLNIDWSNLPPYLIPGDDEYETLLQVNYMSIEGGKPHASLRLFPEISQELSLDQPQQFHLPSITADMCLMDYIPQVEEHLQEKVENLGKSYNKRKLFVQEFLNQFPTHVIECDAEAYNKVTVVVEILHFSFLVTATLDSGFPTTHPTVSLQSLFHRRADEDEPFMLDMKNIPYSPRWTSRTMVEKIKEQMINTYRDFQKRSVSQGVCL